MNLKNFQEIYINPYTFPQQKIISQKTKSAKLLEYSINH